MRAVSQVLLPGPQPRVKPPNQMEKDNSKTFPGIGKSNRHGEHEIANFLVVKLLNEIVELLQDNRRFNMTCPGCKSKNEMAYSILSHSLICLETSCGFEIEMSAVEAFQIFEPVPQLVCA